MKLVAYLRVSTDRQLEGGHGLDAQEDAVRRWAKSNGHRITAIQAEQVTGTNGVDDRTALPLALAMIQAKEVDGLLTPNLDRLARTLHTQEAILGRIWSFGGRVFTVEGGEVLEDDPADPMRTAMRQMRGVFSQLERSMIVNRMAAGRKAKADRGGFAYGSPMYGKRAVDGALVDDPAEQAVIERMQELKASGLSTRAIAAQLNEEGHRAKRGGVWNHVQVWQVLNPEQGRRPRGVRKHKVATSK
jgi:DNA invertase Pin-like site-specific DNA recombinase